MSPYKAFLNNVRQYFNTNGFLRFLLSAYIFIFALGGLLYLLGAFILGVYEPFSIIGVILMYTGLLLTIIREDVMTMVITSAVISLGSLIAWIIALVGTRVYGFQAGGMFLFGPLFYFLALGTLAVLVFIKAEKFKQMRAASAAARQTAGITCPRCGAFVPMNAAFCPACGIQNPATQQYGPVQQAVPMPQYAPPQPQYAPPVPPQAAPPAPEAAPMPEAAPATEAAPKCASCGADVAPGAAFCAKCGAKQ